MKEGFDLSHYWNIGKETQEKQSEQSQASESPSSLRHLSKYCLPSRCMKKKTTWKQSNPNKRNNKRHQAFKDVSARSNVKRTWKAIGNPFSFPAKSSTERQPISVAPHGNAWSSLSVDWEIMKPMSQVFLERIALQHLEEYGDNIEQWSKL